MTIDTCVDRMNSQHVYLTLMLYTLKLASPPAETHGFSLYSLKKLPRLI